MERCVHKYLYNYIMEHQILTPFQSGFVPSSFAIILMEKRELVALLSLSSWCLVAVVWLSLAVPWGCLQFVIVVFPDHTQLLFCIRRLNYKYVAVYMIYIL